jgi:hypothetical protein
MFEKQGAIVIRDTSDLVPTLISVEHELVFLDFDLLSFLGQHELEC